MINGRIVCYGTPSYLMQQYGGGYEVSMTSINGVSEPERWFGKACCEVESQGEQPGTSNKLTIVKVNDLLSQIFATLTQMHSQAVITEFHVARTTLDQVFISFARLQHRVIPDITV